MDDFEKVKALLMEVIPNLQDRADDRTESIKLNGLSEDQDFMVWKAFNMVYGASITGSFEDWCDGQDLYKHKHDLESTYGMWMGWKSPKANMIWDKANVRV